MIGQKGLIIIYVGDGKGKTTAAVGLAVRAAGAGMKVAYTQFAKGEWESAENKVLDELSNIELNIFGKGFVGILGDDKKIEEHRNEAKKSYEFAKEQVNGGKYDLVVMDEIITAVEEGVLTEDEVLDIIKHKPESVHICLTGHKDFPKLFAAADLVTRMQMVKHPYYKGLLAQKGIDY